MKLKLHLLAEVFRDVFSEGFESLKADIACHGVKVSVLTLDGKVVDGERRLLACEQLGIACPSKEWNKRESLLTTLLKLHDFLSLSPMQRALISARLFALRGHLPSDDHKTRAGYVMLLHSSDTSVRRAVTILRDGTPELVTAVAKGFMSLGVAIRISSFNTNKQIDEVSKISKVASGRPKKLPQLKPNGPKRPTRRHRIEAVLADVQVLKEMVSASPSLLKIFALRTSVAEIERKLVKLISAIRIDK